MKTQIAKTIFLQNLEIMKQILDLGEFKLGRKSDDFKYYKREVMDYFFDGMKKLFKQWEQEKLIEKCLCKARLRHGYSKCEFCGGSGYRNT